MRVLITGVTGFAGGHLAQYLSSVKKVELFGFRRARSKKEAPKNVRLLKADLLDKEAVRKALGQIKPDRVFHLAGRASAGQSWQNPGETFKNNVTGTQILLEEIVRQNSRTRVHIAGSAEVYGLCPEGTKVRENAPFHPLNPYAVSKVAQEAVSLHYFKNYRLPVVITRAFNHIGPGQSESFVSSDFAKQVAAIEAGTSKPVMNVGNLGSVRDFTDVRDMVRAYWLALERGKPGEIYNISSGRGRKVSEILQFYLRHSAVKITVRKSSELRRRMDAPFLVGHAGKFQKQTGWKPEIRFEQSLKDILHDWRKRIGACCGK